MPQRDRELEIRDKERRGRTREKEKGIFAPWGKGLHLGREETDVAHGQMGVYKRETL